MPQHKALFLQAKQGAFVINSTETPRPGPGELLVQIHAAALNPADLGIQKNGVLIEQFPSILGADAAGVVEQVGEGVTNLKKGDRVIHPGLFIDGADQTATFQQYALVPAELAAKIPEKMSFDQAASMPLALDTAAIGYYVPTDAPYPGAGLTPPWETAGEGKYKGQGTLILGGASSVGQYAIQLARLSGFSPIVTTGSPIHTEWLGFLGATHIIPRTGDVVSETLKILGSSPSVVFDAISRELTLQQGWDVLAPNGQLVLVLPPGTSHGINQGEDNYGKKIVHILGLAHMQRELGKSLYANLTGLLESGKIKPNRVEVVPGGLAGISVGLKMLEENKASGHKLVLRPQETI